MSVLAFLAAWVSLLLGLAMLLAGLLGAARRRRLVTARFDRLVGTGAADGDDTSDERRVEWPMPEFVRIDMARADLAPKRACLAVLSAVAAAALLGLMFGPAWSLAGGFAALAAGAGVIHWLALRRYRKIIDQLPAFIDRVRQYVIVGASLQTALPRAIESTPAPLSRVMQPVARRIGHGGPVPESIGWLARRLASPELAMIGAAADANLRFGGQLSGVLGNVVRMIRDRLRVGRELRAATSETRASALVLGLLPVVVGAVIVVIQPRHMLFFVQTPVGRTLLLVIGVLYVIGILLMRRIARPEY